MKSASGTNRGVEISVRHLSAATTEVGTVYGQAWVPLTEQAQHLELQVWYPPKILASGEGDRGYRFRLALEKDGVVDQKDTRTSSLDTSSLSVQQLGGRDQAVAVAVPY
jgi:hypothetical protein